MHRFRHKQGLFAVSKANNIGEILIYDAIGGGGWFDDGITAKDFLTKLSALGDVDRITVRINSPGGEVFDGIAMYQALKMHPAAIDVQIDGIAASMASVIAMAGDTISIGESAFMMVHNPSGFCRGESQDMRRVADLLDNTLLPSMLLAYKRSTITEQTLIDARGTDLWFSAAQAVEAKLADRIATPAVASAAGTAKFDMRLFRGAPPAVAAKATDCTCPCEPCVGGDCDGCTDEDCDCEGCTCEAAEGSAKSRKMAAATSGQQQAASAAAAYRSRSLQLSALD